MTRFNSDRAVHAHNRLMMGDMIPAARRLQQFNLGNRPLSGTSQFSEGRKVLLQTVWSLT